MWKPKGVRRKGRRGGGQRRGIGVYGDGNNLERDVEMEMGSGLFGERGREERGREENERGGREANGGRREERRNT